MCSRSIGSDCETERNFDEDFQFERLLEIWTYLR